MIPFLPDPTPPQWHLTNVKGKPSNPPGPMDFWFFFLPYSGWETPLYKGVCFERDYIRNSIQLWKLSTQRLGLCKPEPARTSSYDQSIKSTRKVQKRIWKGAEHDVEADIAGFLCLSSTSKSTISVEEYISLAYWILEPYLPLHKK